MRKLALIALVAFASPALALTGGLAVDTVLGTTMKEVKASLATMGYDVRRAEIEDGQIEVYFVSSDQRGEVYVSPDTGAVTKLKLR